MHGLLRFHGTRHVELDKLPKLKEEIERKSPKILPVEFDASENDCLKIHFSTNQMQIKLNEKRKIELKANNHPRYDRPLCLPGDIVSKSFDTSKYEILHRAFDIDIYIQRFVYADSSARKSEVLPIVSASDRDPFASDLGPSTFVSRALSLRVSSPGFRRVYPRAYALGVARRCLARRP